jgi:hypothetical protein
MSGTPRSPSLTFGITTTRTPLPYVAFVKAPSTDSDSATSAA